MNAKQLDSAGLGMLTGLLRENHLPYQDLTLTGNIFMTFSEGDQLVGAGGLELYRPYALLRSVVVTDRYRGQGKGQAIVAGLIAKAKQESITHVYLLTETAHDFFAKLGFKDIVRENVPVEVSAASEFTTVCPVSAACMQLEIQ